VNLPAPASGHAYAAHIDVGEPAHDVGAPPHVRWWTRNPLRVKLVAAVLALVALGLLVISVASVIFLNRYLVDRADAQLVTSAHSASIRNLQRVVNAGQDPRTMALLPTDYVVAFDVGRGDTGILYPPELHFEDLPPILTDHDALKSHMDKPFTVKASDDKYRWRVLVIELNGQLTVVGQNLSNADYAVDRLVVVELLFGVSVLVLLAMAGAWLVRQSLRPLAAIERTAAAIAGGDLTQRVPELDPRTELGQLSSALNTMLTQIESAFRAREESQSRAVRSEERMRQFVADASHELRTPLTTIRGFAELYRQGAAPDPADVLRRIEGEAARMGLLVEDLLLLARLDRERPMHYAPVRLANVIAEAAEAAHAVAPERTIELDMAGGESLVVAGDEPRLRQIVGNLVTNALAHTPPGTPVFLGLRRDGDRALIEVRDRGPGLTPEQAERVFERFYRVDKARTRRASVPHMDALMAPHSGTGLGLAIVAALVAAHDGAVDVESAPDQGATFRVHLPLAPSQDGQQAPRL
jgi:two-component system OmpR family sensor kinase